MKAELKTKKTALSVESFIASLPDAGQQRDCRTLNQMMEKATGEKGRMWGTIVGFKDVELRYESGRELDWFAMGFAPRKGALTLYLCCGLHEPTVRALLPKLGKHSTGVGCLYLKSLDGIDLAALRSLIALAAKSKLPLASRTNRSAKGASTGASSKVSHGSTSARIATSPKGGRTASAARSRSAR